MKGLLGVSCAIILTLGPAQRAEAQSSDLGLRLDGAVGSIAGPPGTVFGEIVDGLILPDRRIVALDRLFHEVRLFSADGAHLASSGREGDGPGEFRYLETPDFDAELGLSVLDRVAFRLSWHDVGPDSLSFRGSLRLPFETHAHCTVDSRIYLLGLHQGRMIHEVTPAGEILRSFGRPVQAPSLPPPFSGMVQRNFSEGPLDCDEEGEAVLWMMSGTGGIARFDLDGTVRWTRQYPGFVALDSEITERGTHRYSYSEEGWTDGLALTALPADRLIAQVDSMWLPLLEDSRVTKGTSSTRRRGRRSRGRSRVP